MSDPEKIYGEILRDLGLATVDKKRSQFDSKKAEEIISILTALKYKIERREINLNDKEIEDLLEHIQKELKKVNRREKEIQSLFNDVEREAKRIFKQSQ